MLRRVPALLAFLALLLGSVSWPTWYLLIFAALGGWSLWHKNALAWLLMIPLGSFHFWVHTWQRPGDIETYVGQRSVIRLKVLGRHVGKVEAVNMGGQWVPVTGRIGVLPILKEPWGTELVLKGRLVMPPDTGQMNWRAYLRGEGASVLLIPNQRLAIRRPQNFLARLRRMIATHIRTNLVDSTAQALVEALVLGDRSRLTSEIQKSFRKTGTFHLLALSGLHVGLVFSLLLIFFQFLRFPYRMQWVLAVGGLFAYLGLIGPKPSLVRGVLFVVTFVLAYFMERPRMALNALGVAGLVSLFFFPFWRWSVGFQLSYLATLGILLWVPLFPRIRPRILKGILLAFLVSIVAQVYIAPLLIQTFHGISLAAPILNVPLISLTWLLLAEAFLALLFTPIAGILASPFWALTEAIAQMILFMVRSGSTMPGAYLSIPSLSPLFMRLFTTALVILSGLAIVLQTKKKPPWMSVNPEGHPQIH